MSLFNFKRKRADPSCILIKPSRELDFSNTSIEGHIRKTPFVRGYVIAALRLVDKSEPKSAERLDFSDDSLRMAYEDCEAFVRENLSVFRFAYPMYQLDGSEGDEVGDYAGRDFWMARNNLPSGFWSKVLGKHGQELGHAAIAAGLVNYCSANGQLHFVYSKAEIQCKEELEREM